jgi:glycosyltransferase involved in cell wall biosynthesis
MLIDVAPTIVVAHGSEPLKYMMAAGGGLPLVYYRIGVSHLRGRQRLRRALHGYLVRRADIVVGVSSACVDEVVADYDIARVRTAVIPNGRRPEDFPPKTYEAEPGTLRLVFVGHLTETKRPDVFLDIVAALQSSGCAVSGTVVGGGPLLPQVAERAASLGIAVTGPTTRVAEILRESDVLVFTSVPTGEGMPGVLIEAGLVGLPSVVTDVPGARDVIIDGKTGFVVPSDMPMEAVEHLLSLAGDVGERHKLGTAARERCMAHFTLTTSAQAWAVLLESLLEGPKIS